MSPRVTEWEVMWDNYCIAYIAYIALVDVFPQYKFKWISLKMINNCLFNLLSACIIESHFVIFCYLQRLFINTGHRGDGPKEL